MSAHLRASLILVVLTLGICCILYPLSLWIVGQTLFPAAASGSLVTDQAGTVRGSRLIAQPFNDPKYFHPRPSAVGYNGAGSGGSNLAASNPLLRDRVARQLGPLVRYADGEKKGQRAGRDIERWFVTKPALLGVWAEDNPTLAGRWVKDDANVKPAAQWSKDHPEVHRAWKAKNATADDPPADRVKDWPDSLAVELLKNFATVHPRTWPVPAERKGVSGPETYFRPARPDVAGTEEIQDLQATLFDAWLQAHPQVASQLRRVPADMVMASGSGLDPHITLRNALYQLEDRVAEARAKETKRPRKDVQRDIEEILRQAAFTPLGGLVGEPLVNVLEVDLELDARLQASGR